MELTPEKFQRIAMGLAPEAKNAVFEPCPDQSVGTLADIHGASGFRRSDIGDSPSQNRVILVMESPHKAEFDNGTPVGPANGPTGVNIRDLLNEVLRCLGPLSENSQVVLMNAVQYQCSLGESTKDHRDVVFQEAWREGGEQDFRERLIDTIRQGDVVINACTRGNKKVHLRDMVKAVIDEVVGSHWRTVHPSAWRYRNGTKAFPQPSPYKS